MGNKERIPSNSRAYNDLGVIAVLAVLVFIVASIFGMRERIETWVQTYGTHPIDEILIVIAVLGIAFGIFAWRRWSELRDETTKRQQMTEALEVEHRLLQTVIEGMGDGIYVKDLQGRYALINSVAACSFGKSVEEVVGKSDTELFPTDIANSIRENDQEIIATGKTQVSEETRTVVGFTQTYLTTKGVHRDLSENVIGLIGTCRDVTKYKQAEKAIRAQAHQQAAVADLGQRALAGLDPARLTDEAMALVTHTLEVEYCGVLEPLPDSNTLLLRAGRGWREGLIGQATVSTGPTWLAGYTLQANEPVVVENLSQETRFTGSPLLHEHGIVSGISVIIQGQAGSFGILEAHTAQRRSFTKDDVHFLQAIAHVLAAAIERKQAEAALQASEKRYRMLFERNLAGVFRGTLDGQLLECNDAFAHILGYGSAQEIMTKKSWDFYFDQIDREIILARLQEQDTITDLETRLRRKDGAPVWVLGNITLLDEAGRFSAVLQTFVDITERKQVEEALQASEERYRSLFENANDIVYTHDLKGNFTSINKAGERITGYMRSEVLQMNLAQVVVPEHREWVKQMLAHQLFEDPSIIYELDIIAKDGRRVPLEVSIQPIYRDGEPIGCQGIGRDVTERHHLESQLRQAQKLEAIGRLAGGVAHDFNNLLLLITGYSDLLMDYCTNGQPPRSFVEEIKKAGERAAGLTRQLLAFSRKQVLEQKVIDLNKVVTDVNKMLCRLIGEDIDLITIPDPARLWIKADPGQIEQVLLNLAVNARDAMPQGGQLTVQTSKIEFDEFEAHQHIGIQAGPHVLLTVSDTGCGMNEQTQSHIFEPFFTTKGPEQGTGLGLATVYGIITQSGGSVEVSSEVGHGSTFRIYLPRVKPAAEEAQLNAAGTASRQGSETILLVEDEDTVRALVRRVLQMSNYTVLEAGNGREALQMAERHTGLIHLMISDVVMPGMCGGMLHKHISALRPDIKVLYISGYTGEAIVNHGEIEPGSVFLQKPFTPQDLTLKVAEVLNEPTVEKPVQSGRLSIEMRNHV